MKCVDCKGEGCGSCGNSGLESEAVKHGIRRKSKTLNPIDQVVQDLKKEIAALETEWERIDSQGQDTKQHKITQDLTALRSQLAWCENYIKEKKR